MDESWRPILRLFKIIPPSKETAIAFGAAIGFIILISVMVHIVLYLKRRRKYIFEEWDWFYRMCEAKDLSVREMKILREMIRNSRVKNFGNIFKSVKLFDKCIDFEFKRLEITEEEREEFADEISELRRKLHFDRFPPGEILNSTRGITPEQRIRMEFTIYAKKHYVSSTILDVKEDSIYVLMPEDEKYNDLFKVGQHLEIYFWRSGDAGYKFSTVINNVMTEPPGVLQIDHSKEIERSQRRHYFRIDVSLPLYFRPLTEKQKSTIKENRNIFFPKESKPYSGMITSLSGGGISFISGLPFEKGDILWLGFHLFESLIISNIYGRVIRSKKISEDRFKIFLEFLLITDKEREIIVGFVASKQRKSLKSK
ncbi:MAG: flagellar brake protein [Candidatus Helarchaeota archaeon]|nr:flagellar brake protein [Candidatus Helarchaeota archaeon]